MNDRSDSGPGPTRNPTAVERTSDFEMVVRRTFDAPPRIVFDAWTTPELMSLWWAPKSLPIPLLSCEMDVRVGGGYRFTFGKDGENTFSFFGKYLEVTPPSRLVWTNEESDDGAVTTVTFEEQDGQTLLVLHDRYPTKAALEEALAGMAEALPEQFGQLDELLVTLVADAQGS